VLAKGTLLVLDWTQKGVYSAYTQRGHIRRRCIGRENPELGGMVRIVDDIDYLSSQSILETPLPLRHADDGNRPEIDLSGTLEVHFIEKYFASFMRRVAVGPLCQTSGILLFDIVSHLKVILFNCMYAKPNSYFLTSDNIADSRKATLDY